MQKTLIYILCALSLLACAHKIDIQQGNVVSEEQLAKLKTGMDTEKVRLILGTPLLADPFHNERWDYFYSMGKSGSVQERYRVTLYFRKDKLQRIERHGPVPKKDLPVLNKTR